MQHTMNLIIDMRDLRANDLQSSGAKGANLAQLLRAGIRVPAGLIISQYAFQAWAAFVKESLPHLFAPLEDGERELQDTELDLKSELLQTGLPAELEAELRQALPRLLLEGPVILRKSFVDPTVQANFPESPAGEVLVLNSESELRRAVLGIYATSLIHLLDGKRRDGRHLFEEGPAVIVQRFVDSHVSGRARLRSRYEMDAHGQNRPSNSNSMPGAETSVGTKGLVPSTESDLIVEAVYGLAGGLERWPTSADHFVLDTMTRKVSNRLVGGKARALMAGSSGAMEVSVAPIRAGRAALGDNQLGLIADLYEAVSQEFGAIESIEWSFARGELFLLGVQTRNRLPEHWGRNVEFIRRRFPTSMTPLAWDLLGAGYSLSLSSMQSVLGLPAREGQWLRWNEGKIEGNLAAIDLLIQSGRQAIRYQHAESSKRNSPKSDRTQHWEADRDAYPWLDELLARWMRELDRFLLRLTSLSKKNFAKLNEAELWNHILEVREMGLKFARPKLSLSMAREILIFDLKHLLAGRIEERRAKKLVDDLCYFPNSRSHLINIELFGLLDMVLERPELEAALVAGKGKHLIESGELHNFAAFARAFEDVLENHGHRSLIFDLYHASWNQEPWTLLDSLGEMAKRHRVRKGITTPDARARRLQIRRGKAELRLLAMLPEALRGPAFERIQKIELLGKLDDLEHYQSTRLGPPLRRAVLEFGQRLVDGHIIAKPEDVFFLHAEQIEDWLASRIDSDQLTSELMRTRAAFEARIASETLAATWTMPWRSNPESHSGAEAITREPAVRIVGASRGKNSGPRRDEGD